MSPSTATSGKDAYQVLAETSRTFFLPILRLHGGARDAVASAYLALRAIDEIEDHRSLPAAERSRLLRCVAEALERAAEPTAPPELTDILALDALPEVTRRLPEWLELAPAVIRGRIFEATSGMALRMARWVDRDFRIDDEADLDRYTYAVAGAVGLLLADLWQWWDGTPSDRTLAVGFGRGLQAVNIARNREEDLAAGVNFLPPGWGAREIDAYARRQLLLADRYCESLPRGPIREFSDIPLALAHGSLDALAAGREKLTRAEVEAIVARCVEPRAT
jgi:farnesyl-diphosphate farnesyltransferase